MVVKKSFISDSTKASKEFAFKNNHLSFTEFSNWTVIIHVKHRHSSDTNYIIYVRPRLTADKTYNNELTAVKKLCNYNNEWAEVPLLKQTITLPQHKVRKAHAIISLS